MIIMKAKRAARRIHRTCFIAHKSEWNAIITSLTFRMADDRALPFARELSKLLREKTPRPNGDVALYITKQQRALAFRALEAAGIK